MADSGIVYMRLPASVPGNVFAFALSAKALLEIEEGALQSVVEELAAYVGFLSEAAMEKVILRHVSDEERAGRLAKALATVEAIGRRGGDLDQLLDQARTPLRVGGGEQGFSAEDVIRLRKVFQVVRRSYPGLALQAKAEHLAAAVGLRAEAVDLICDLRPVFDDSRTKVEGLIPLTTLRIISSGVDQIPVSVEVVLSARDVQDLLQKVQAAVRKLNVLGELAEQNGLPIPAINLTETRD